MDKKEKEETKQTRGRPVKNIIEPIDAPAEDIAKAISLAGHKKIKSKFRVGRKAGNEVC